MDYKADFINFMARAEVLTFGDFTTKSGRKTPYFVNTGKYNDGEAITKLGEFYAHCIMKNCNITEETVLFGPAYKGIPLVITVAIALFKHHGINIKYCFNRKEAKTHGEGGEIVGHKLSSGDKVIVIEDVITAGTAIREVLPIIEQTGATVEALIVSVNRMEKGQNSEFTAIQEIKKEFGIVTHPIVNVKDVLKHLHNQPLDGKILIDDELKSRMESYMSEYCNLEENV
ncbi:MAG: orotate phosphoribosyltransferase [Defluviitaleaceae bacterium]|nr:orotate phosphoribosyltransferase [Defluviitaleaceae bacterium]